MAKSGQGFELEIPEDFLKGLTDNDFYDIAEEALRETAPILEKSIKESILSAESDESTKEAVNSVKVKGPKKTTTDGMIVNVGPTGYSNQYYKDSRRHVRKYKVSNALKLIWLNYGNRSGAQPPRPWLTRAIVGCENIILDKIQKVWEERTDTK